MSATRQEPGLASPRVQGQSRAMPSRARNCLWSPDPGLTLTCLCCSLLFSSPAGDFAPESLFLEKPQRGSGLRRVCQAYVTEGPGGGLAPGHTGLSSLLRFGGGPPQPPTWAPLSCRPASGISQDPGIPERWPDREGGSYCSHSSSHDLGGTCVREAVLGSEGT